jgi:CBS domain-containing membrane protein
MIPQNTFVGALRARFGASLKGAMRVALAASVLGLATALLNAPFLSPPLGASTWVCVRNRGAKTASPRNVVLAHTIAVVAGRLARLICGAPVFAYSGEGFPTATLLAGVVALGITAFFMDLFNCAHGPAGATTLIVALGLLATNEAQLALIGAAAILSTMLYVRKRTVRQTANPDGAR